MLDKVLSDQKENFNSVYSNWGILLISTGVMILSLTAISHYYDYIGRLGFIVNIGVGISTLITGRLIRHLSFC